MSLGKITDEISERFYPVITYTIDLDLDILGLYNDTTFLDCTTKYQYSNSQFNKIKKREKQISIVTINKREAYKKKFCITNNILPVT